jgi:hypothetical protein
VPLAVSPRQRVERAVDDARDDLHILPGRLRTARDQLRRRLERRPERREHADPRSEPHRLVRHRLVDPQDRHRDEAVARIDGRPDRRARDDDHVRAGIRRRLHVAEHAPPRLRAERAGLPRVGEQALVDDVEDVGPGRELLGERAEDRRQGQDGVDEPEGPVLRLRAHSQRC